ncbi:hypothetical protein VCO01S_21180 [Vibrio comitans NBRC 102076]|uniref:Uncharacterized protein n=1 Tax=Vibrio comitans NBRC 102076 TaxID=1219078 RepID=A0A4Y3IP76_9VIBR|nr:hypothetical protein VCO01S_21180 [Vibrio comitans NBRC 102076]
MVSLVRNQKTKAKVTNNKLNKSANCQPVRGLTVRCDNGTIEAEESVEPIPMVKVYRDVITAIRVGKFILTATGKRTLPIAIPAPMNTVPKYKVATLPNERKHTPKKIENSARQTLFFKPNRVSTVKANGEIKAKESSGNEESIPRIVELRCNSSMI